MLSIPLDKVLELGKNSDIFEMGKTSKFNSNNFTSEHNPHSNTDIGVFEKIKGKLFFYFLNIICDESNKKICRNCNKSYIQKDLFITNLPSILSFSLTNSNLFSFSLNDILASFVLIPTIFELGQLFDNSHPNKVFFEFFAVVMIRRAMNYSIAIKCDDTSWKYVKVDERVVQCSSWSEVIEECLKNHCSPIMILYRIQERYSHNEKDLDVEDIKGYVRFIQSIGQYKNDNAFRTKESVIPIDALNKAFNSDKTVIREKNKEVMRTNSSASNIKSASKSINDNDKQNRDNFGYNCIFCGGKNKIDSQYCLFCKKSNRDLIHQLMGQGNKKDLTTTEVKNKKDLLKQNLFNKPSSSLIQNNPQILARDNKKAIDQVFESAHKKLSSNKEDDPIVIAYRNQKDLQQRIQMNSNVVSREISQENNIRIDQKSKYHRQIKRILSNPEWKCDICLKYNKPTVYKCESCKTMNHFQRDLLEGINANPTEQFRPQQNKPQKRPINHYSSNQRKKLSNTNKLQKATYAYSTKLNKRQMSLGNINKKPFDSDRDSNAHIEKQKTSSIKLKRPSSSNKMTLTNTSTKADMINHHQDCKMKKNITEPMIRPKTSVPKYSNNPFT